MAVVIARNLVLGLAGAVTGGNRPLIGWHNVITPTGIEASQGEAIRLANPNTASRWVSTGPSTITVSTQGQPVDYIGIARHNLGSQGAVVSVVDGDGAPVVDEVVLPGDGPHIIRFAPTGGTITISISTAAYIGVLYVGRLTGMPSMLQDHVPVDYADNTEVVSGLAESGDFLGRIVINETKSSDMRFMEVDYGWFQSELGPFVQAARTIPFFFSWVPSDRPDSVGFGWLANDIRPRVFRHVPNDLVCDFEIQFGALVR